LSGFESLPGWQHDDFSKSWPAFLSSCQVLDRRSESWRAICERARQIDGQNNLAIRAFFEHEFSAYQIRDVDRRPDGVVTGYFESEIAGSRKYQPPFIYPVYGQPNDMLFLNTSKLPVRKGVVAARVQEREVQVQTGPVSGEDVYELDLSQISSASSADRRVRLRIEGKRLLPYYTRQEIETRGAPNARVLAFVSSAAALYEMQIQGSGRIRLPDGEIIRLGYAEQNGHPFRPMLAAGTKMRTRGSLIELEVDDDDEEGTDTTAVRVRGFKLALPASSGAVAVPGQRIAGVAGSGNTDPSYVFFKENAANAIGPIGALGVPLQPRRSIAVDPRSTPLGYPVFVSTRLPGKNGPLRQLTVAQDTGGSIRGAVRADYFFGNGEQAAQQARRMKQHVQLWVLLPRGQVVAAAGGTTLTRGGAAGSNLAQCLVPDEENCVED
jgi:membrane-bound lytic murein transglycosylase A